MREFCLSDFTINFELLGFPLSERKQDFSKNMYCYACIYLMPDLWSIPQRVEILFEEILYINHIYIHIYEEIELYEKLTNKYDHT